jgi:hypothetical protein
VSCGSRSFGAPDGVTWSVSGFVRSGLGRDCHQPAAAAAQIAPGAGVSRPSPDSCFRMPDWSEVIPGQISSARNNHAATESPFKDPARRGISQLETEVGDERCPVAPCCAPRVHQGLPSNAQTCQVSTKSLRKGTGFTPFSTSNGRPWEAGTITPVCPPRPARGTASRNWRQVRNFCRQACSYPLDIRLLSLDPSSLGSFFFGAGRRAATGRRDPSGCPGVTAPLPEGDTVHKIARILASSHRICPARSCGECRLGGSMSVA